jgi:Fic family protein
MTYNPDFLNYTPIFTQNELELLESINSNLSLESFLKNKNLVEKFGFDFVYTSAKIEGNTYSKADALTLLEYGKTSGGKSYSDAKMLLNLNKAFKYILNDDCHINKHKIRAIHQILADDLVNYEDIGAVRKKGVLIKGSDYIPLSDSITLESELDRMLGIYQTIQDPYDKALYIHNNLAYLQYFADVNKRTARTMLNLSLKCDDKMLLIPQEELILLYIEGILEYYENGSSGKSKEFFIKSYEKMDSLIKEINNGK